MNNKQAIQLSKKKRTTFLFQKLKMCKKCNRYSVLKDDHCYQCGNRYTEVESLAKTIFKNKLFTQAVSILIFVCIGIILAPTVKDLYLSMAAGILFCACYVVIHIFFKKSEYLIQLNQLLNKDLFKMKKGIHFDSELAKDDVRDDNIGAAYEKLREIGDFIINDEMKTRRTMLLNQIHLRKDMELELETLVPSSYDKDFIRYAIEVCKINKSLVTKRVLRYFATYEYQVKADFGVEPLVLICGAALRMKLYMLEFKDLIATYLDHFSKERMLRLCSMIQSNPTEDWEVLAEKTKLIVNTSYDYDPDFKGFF